MSALALHGRAFVAVCAAPRRMPHGRRVTSWAGVADCSVPAHGGPRARVFRAWKVNGTERNA